MIDLGPSGGGSRAYACNSKLCRYMMPFKTSNDNDRELLYILSHSYSGSTLLTLLLAAHPKIATVGELKASAMGDIETYRCSCGALLNECEFWRQVQHGMQERGASFSLANIGTHFNNGGRAFRRLIQLCVRHPMCALLSSITLDVLPSYKRRVMTIMDQNRLLIDVITTIQGGRVFLDGSKDPARLNQFLARSLWKIKVIHLVRDGRGVVNSYMKHYRVDTRAAAREWVSAERECDRVLSRLSPSNVLTITYEDLCGDPQAVVGRILTFVGLDQTLQGTRSSASGFHILGNKMRLDSTGSIAVDETWKKDLRSEDLDVFEAMAGARNRRHGYI